MTDTNGDAFESPELPVWRDPRVRRGMERQFQELADSGSDPVGWKLGLGTAAAMEATGTSGPLLGFLTDETAVEDGAVIDIGSWQKATLEPELVIFLGEDVSADADSGTAAAAISAVGIALEVVDINLPLGEVEALLAVDIFHRNYLLGPGRNEFAGGDVAGLSLEVELNGEKVASTDEPTALVGDLVDLTLHTASYLSAFGRGLEAGQFIISGAIIPPIFPDPGDILGFSAGNRGELGVRFR